MTLPDYPINVRGEIEMTEWKLCPFCGRDGGRIVNVPHKNDYAYAVRCGWCGIQTVCRDDEISAKQDWQRRPNDGTEEDRE